MERPKITAEIRDILAALLKQRLSTQGRIRWIWPRATDRLCRRVWWPIVCGITGTRAPTSDAGQPNRVAKRRCDWAA